MKNLLRVFSAVHAFIAFLFFCAALLLVASGIQTSWIAIGRGFDGATAQAVIEAIGLIAVAVVSVQISQTIIEEEVIRQAHVSAPTRVRRFLSRFLVVVIIALAIEGLVATFKAVHENIAEMPHAATILIAVAFLLAGWGIFVRLNRFAEELEPEAMAQAKNEDQKLE
jgi:hypothetical protein